MKSESCSSARVVLVILGILVVCGAAVYGRLLYLGWSEFSAGKSALSAGNTNEAIIHFDRTLQFYLPWGGASESGAMELFRLAGELESRDETQLALEAYRAVRGGLYGARGVYTPHREWIARCDEKIARLTAKLPPVTDKEKGQTVEQRYRDALAALSAPVRPNLVGSLAAVVGLLGWVGATLGLIWKGLDRRPGMGRRLLYWGATVILFYLFWLIGLATA